MAGRLNILVAGVGGQGLITLARILAESAVEAGSNALVAETHGLSQRGGSVEVHVRLGDVHAPLIPRGGADVVLGLELLEAARRAGMLSPSGFILTSDVVMRPAVPGVKVPPKDRVVEALRDAAKGRVAVVPASRLAREAGGSTLYVNTVMLGALAGTGLLDPYVPLEVLEKNVSGMKRGQENLKAFRLGFDYCKSSCRNLGLQTH